jgi:hypothetical protein
MPSALTKYDVRCKMFRNIQSVCSARCAKLPSTLPPPTTSLAYDDVTRRRHSTVTATASSGGGGGSGSGGIGLLHRATMLVICIAAFFMTSSSTAMTSSSGCAFKTDDDAGINGDVKLEDIPDDGLADVVIVLPITKSIGMLITIINLCHLPVCIHLICRLIDSHNCCRIESVSFLSLPIAV